MIRRPLVRHVLALVSLPLGTLSTNLPYNPTSILLPPSDDGHNYAYIIQPGSDSTSSAQFSSLDLSKTLDASSLSLNDLSSHLPFLSPGSSTAYTTFSDPSGNITVLAGDCTAGASGTQLWRFTQDPEGQNGQGTWAKDDTTSQGLGNSASMAGSNFLSSAVAFSTTASANASNTDLFVFGGMCPLAGATQDKWTTAANYSNLMVTLAPEVKASGDADYHLSLVTSQGAPIAEAGFSMTALPPTYSNASGSQAQQQDFVLLGGHTQAAFINMSQVALFSLPQSTWSFLPVQQPSDSKKHVSRRNAAITVTPRSGHTAVLTKDGKSIVVYGGWVGDVSTPATPQLVVLSLGAGYGGQGTFSWTAPSSTGSATFKADGLYGHGAAMLPGDVMMIMGGYSIPSSASTSRLMRRSSPVQNTQALFYNVSSSSWISSYSIPADLLTAASAADNKGHLTTTAQKAGLGVGVIIAVAAVVGMVVFVLWFMRRRRRQHDGSDGHSLVHEKRSFDEVWRHSGQSGHEGDMPMVNNYGDQSPTKEAFPWLPQVGENGYQSIQGSAREVDSSGAFLNIPSPTRGLRRASGSRANYQYQAAPTTEGSTNLTSTGIHPIEEADEDVSVKTNSRPVTAEAERRLKAMQEIFDPESKLRAAARVLNDTHTEDPFRDPEPNPLGSHPVSPDPENNVRRAPTTLSSSTITPSVFGDKTTSINKDQITGWVNEWSSQNPHITLHSNTIPGRLSPSKSIDDRTSSTLSDESQRSYLSARSARSIARTTSTRSNAFFGLAGPPRISPNTSPTDAHFPASTGRRSPPRNGINRNRSITAPSRRHDPTGHPNVTFAQLRTESETLLGASADPYRATRPSKSTNRASSQYSQETDFFPTMSGGSASAIPQRRIGTLLGSLRRALGTNSIYTTSGEENAAAGANAAADTASSSPTKFHGIAVDPPRRTASDSSAFLRLKRGQEDWSAAQGEKVNAWEPYRDDVDGGDWGSPTPPADSVFNSHKRRSGGFFGDGVGTAAAGGGDEMEEKDWDVEKAAEGRDVQVMFTVPKARLRVVNADVERASLRSVSEGAVSNRGKRDEEMLVDVEDKVKEA